MAFMRMLSSLCELSTHARRGEAGMRIPLHDGCFGPRGKEISRSSPTGTAADASLRASMSAARACSTWCRSASQRTTWRASSPSASPSPSLLDPPVARSALWKNIGLCDSGRGCHSGARMHVGAPVTTVFLGNSTTAVRLRAGLIASDVGKTSNWPPKSSKNDR